MDTIKLRTVLSSVLLELSEREEVIRKKMVKTAKRNMRMLALELKRQMLFLIHFKYSYENIQNHLMKKASAFFGVDLEEKETKRMLKNKPKRIKIRLKTKGDVTRKRIIKPFGQVMFGKKEKKIEENFYRPPK